MWTLWIPFAILLSTLLYTLIVRKAKNKQGSSLPPGPSRGLPILGHLLMLGEFPHRDLHHLSKQYGPIMHLRLGLIPTIVASSPQAAELFLKTHDLVFASRPFTQAAMYISYDQKGMSFSKYGAYWRNLRKVCTLELLSSLKIESFKGMRKEEVTLFVESLKEVARGHSVVDLSTKVTTLSTDMACRMVLGKKYVEDEAGQRGLHAFVHEGMHLSALPNIADYVPYIGALDLQGLNKRMKAVFKFFDDFFEKIIHDHVNERSELGDHRDFVDVMLSVMHQSKDTEFPIDASSIKAVMLDILVGSMDTTATAIEWIISEILKNPSVMREVQQELEQVVGLGRMVEESNIINLDYLEMVMKETFRLHPVAPLLIPHESMKDCTVNGFHIPRKSRVIVNTWAIGRDPNVWPDADKFLPERFRASKIDFRGRDFQLLPFGSGRRGCPGMQLGITVVKLVVAQLMHCFNWELPDGMLPEELNMDERFGLTSPRAKHLCVIPKYRLSI
ncbi:hypothetical protein Syun_014178 [Stephania yunnanensis]|uniref:Cytochrome P450 n=1 Tax=Stephania yunnanensis TaxID=152371 RepID=A0AAP0JIT2_9MAGN